MQRNHHSSKRTGPVLSTFLSLPSFTYIAMYLIYFLEASWLLKANADSLTFQSIEQHHGLLEPKTQTNYILDQRLFWHHCADIDSKHHSGNLECDKGELNALKEAFAEYTARLLKLMNECEVVTLPHARLNDVARDERQCLDDKTTPYLIKPNYPTNDMMLHRFFWRETQLYKEPKPQSWLDIQLNRETEQCLVEAIRAVNHEFSLAMDNLAHRSRESIKAHMENGGLMPMERACLYAASLIVLGLCLAALFYPHSIQIFIHNILHPEDQRVRLGDYDFDVEDSSDSDEDDLNVVDFNEADFNQEDDDHSQEERELSAEEYNKALELDLICPISLSLMTDPVKANDGKTYERKSIMPLFLTARCYTILSPYNRVDFIDWHTLQADEEKRAQLAAFIAELDESPALRPH